MKTDKQKERDKKSGVVNLVHEFDTKTGKITSKGLIRKEVNPEDVIESMEPVKQKLAQLKENINHVKRQLEAAPVSCESEVLEFMELQQKAGVWRQAESLREQLKARSEEFDTLTDDILEQEGLLQEYREWKK